MSFKVFILCAAFGLAGCVSAPYSPDTAYQQAPTAPPAYAPSYIIVAPPPATPYAICTATPAGCSAAY